MKELTELNEDKRHIIGYMDRRDQPEYDTVRKVAASLKDECLFHVGFGEASQQMHPPGMIYCNNFYYTLVSVWLK